MGLLLVVRSESCRDGDRRRRLRVLAVVLGQQAALVLRLRGGGEADPRGPRPRSACDAGAPASPTPMPTNPYPRATFQYGMPSFQSSSIVRKPRNTNT